MKKAENIRRLTSSEAKTCCTIGSVVGFVWSLVLVEIFKENTDLVLDVLMVVITLLIGLFAGLDRGKAQTLEK